MEPTHTDTGKRLVVWKQTIVTEELRVLELDKPSLMNGYTHALQAPDGETIGWLKPKASGGYEVNLYDGWKVNNPVIQLPED